MVENSPATSSLPISIGGIKFSEELAQLDLSEPTADTLQTNRLLHLLNIQKINIPFLCHSTISGGHQTTFCIAAADFSRVQELLNETDFAETGVKTRAGVGLLTIFPHRNDFDFLGTIINLCADNSLPFYSFCTSISAMAFLTDFNKLDIVAEKLQYIFELPENHAPFRQDFQVKQIQV